MHTKHGEEKKQRNKKKDVMSIIKGVETDPGVTAEWRCTRHTTQCQEG